MNTIRRYPRTLAEAFPDERAAAIELPARSSGRAGLWIVLCIAAAAAVIVIHITRYA